jgi:hypothetical protein
MLTAPACNADLTEYNIFLSAISCRKCKLAILCVTLSTTIAGAFLLFFSFLSAISYRNCKLATYWANKVPFLEGKAAALTVPVHNPEIRPTATHFSAPSFVKHVD